MKSKYISVIMIGCAILLFYMLLFGGNDDSIVKMPKYDSVESYSDNGFMDWMIYSKYIYNDESIKKFESHDKFKKVTENDIENIKDYFENFEGLMTQYQFMDLEKYEFKWSQIKTNDYYYIYDKEGTAIGQSAYEKYYCYDVYYVDMEKGVVYGIHNKM